jgi:hypothetical protein
LDPPRRACAEDVHRNTAKALVLFIASTEAGLKSADRQARRPPVSFHFGTRVPFRHSSIDSTFQNEQGIAVPDSSTWGSFRSDGTDRVVCISLSHTT